MLTMDRWCSAYTAPRPQYQRKSFYVHLNRTTSYWYWCLVGGDSPFIGVVGVIYRTFDNCWYSMAINDEWWMTRGKMKVVCYVTHLGITISVAKCSKIVRTKWISWNDIYYTYQSKKALGTWVPLYNSELWVLTLLQTILQSNGEEDDEDTTID